MSYTPTAIVAVGVTLPVLAVIALSVRIIVRKKVKPTFLGIDDWLAVGATILAAVDGANLAVEAILGDLGRVYPDKIPDDEYIVWGKSDYAQVIIEKPLYAMIKLSACFFYRRIFKIHKYFKMLNTFMIISLILWATAFLFAEAFTCGIHPEIEWIPGRTRDGCLDETWLNLAFAITDALGDIIVVTMPLPMIAKLQINKREKIGLFVIFCLAYLSVAASIVRLGFIGKAWTKNFSGGGNDHGASTAPSFWSTVEGSVGVIAVCLPPIGPLFRKGYLSSKVIPTSLRGIVPSFTTRMRSQTAAARTTTAAESRKNSLPSVRQRNIEEDSAEPSTHTSSSTSKEAALEEVV